MPKLIRELEGLPRKIRATALRNLADATEALEGSYREVLSVRGSRHDRSRPGEAPRYQTGRLWASVHREVDAARLTGRVVVGAPYASYLAPTRPFPRLAWEKAKPRVDEVMARY